MRKNLTLAFFALFCALTAAAQLHNDDVHVHEAVSRQNYRQYLRIPDIGGYITLKCDFHVHSDISDGQVWPVGRVNEAWNDGLDAIAMTDHIEVHKNADIIRCGLNKPYELAKARGDMIGMIVIPARNPRDTPGQQDQTHVRDRQQVRPAFRRPSGLLRLSHARLCGAGAAHRHHTGRGGRIYELHPRQGQVLHPHILGIGRRGSALRRAAATDTVFCYRSYI